MLMDGIDAEFGREGIEPEADARGRLSMTLQGDEQPPDPLGTSPGRQLRP